MPTRLLLGNEALAQGAIDAGLSGAYAYPGTPATEITEYILRTPEAQSGDIACHWTANEKTALEAALGMSYAGKRVIASMKHVGLNVAADPLINAAIAGANGGLLIIVSDDPSMHSSQNEQDSRLYPEIALTPCVEPSDQQEAYAIPSYAFALSERYRVPVLVRLTTRLSHTRATVEVGKKRSQNPMSLPADPERYILLPALAREAYTRLVQCQAEFLRESEQSPFSSFHDAGDHSLGVVTCGIAHAYLMEVTDGACPHPVLKIGQYPIPETLLARLVETCERVLVLEEGFPYVESKLRGVPARSSPPVLGRLSGHLPRTGELTPQAVAKAFGGHRPSSRTSPIPMPRPPALCPGCPHIDTCKALQDVLTSRRGTGRVFSDIGCYTLGALPPYGVIDTCVEMGASIPMAKGASEAGIHPAIALLGDSTFAHSGMTGLLDCVNERADVTVIIVDNLTVAMTGGQRSAVENRLISICRGLGVDPDHVRVIEPHPKNHGQNVAVLEEELVHPGPSVIIARRECVQTARRRSQGGREGGSTT